MKTTKRKIADWLRSMAEKLYPMPNPMSPMCSMVPPVIRIDEKVEKLNLHIKVPRDHAPCQPTVEDIEILQRYARCKMAETIAESDFIDVRIENNPSCAEIDIYARAFMVNHRNFPYFK